MSGWAITSAGVLYLIAAVSLFMGGQGMSDVALGMCGCLYCFATYDLARSRNYGMAFAFANYALSCVALMLQLLWLVFLSYALANAGLTWAAKK